MTGYFIAGNFWLFAALVMVLGRKVARTQPTMYSFFDVGGWYYPGTYNLWIGVCLIAALTCLALAWTSRRRTT